MVFVVIALSLRFNLAEIPNFDVVGVVVFSTGAGAGSAPNSCKQSKRNFKMMIFFSNLIDLSNKMKENGSQTIHSTFYLLIYKHPSCN